MNRVTSGDAEIAYTKSGAGPPVVLLHAFPVHHALWEPAAQLLASRYNVILPDLRGHGESGAGAGPATMAKHAADVARICDQEGVGRAVFAGVSIGGYILFELWRHFRGRVAGLVLCDTRAQADSPEGRAGRLQSAADVRERGTEPFLEGLLPRLIGRTTQQTRPDRVAEARAMATKTSAQGISLVQQGMAERPDSVETLKTSNVPALVMVGDEDVVTPVADAHLMANSIPGAEMKVIPRAGHFAVWEQPEEAGRRLRQFLDSLHGA
jgi:pimeloyl-ACP methyl ester carboxylesterase